MEEKDKLAIIEKGKDYFRSIIIPNHLKRFKDLKLNDFKVNPFLVNYLAALLCGDTAPISIAKALIYPRVLGTSINTSFGTNIQIFISSLAEVTGNASPIDGIDIEFIDALDNRRKYCQCKAGPDTINKDDVDTIIRHFNHVIQKARIDRINIGFNDLVVGVLYGERNKLSSCYKKIEKSYPVYSGAEFWKHLTGDEHFYSRLSKAFGEVVEEENIDGSQIIIDKIKEIAEEIKKRGGI